MILLGLYLSKRIEMVENLNKYVGLNYRFDLSNNSYNCLSLAKKFYKDHDYKQNFDDGSSWPTNYKDNYARRLISYLENNFTKIEDIDSLSYGDIVVISPGIRIGTYVGEGNLLTISSEFKDDISKSIIYPLDYWKNNFIYV